MRVVVTGAAGQIGTEVVKELSQSHQLCLIDLRRVNGQDSIVADLARRPVTARFWRWLKPRSARWSDALKGAQVVVHLAANIDPAAPWEKPAEQH